MVGKGERGEKLALAESKLSLLYPRITGRRVGIGTFCTNVPRTTILLSISDHNKFSVHHHLAIIMMIEEEWPGMCTENDNHVLRFYEFCRIRQSGWSFVGHPLTRSSCSPLKLLLTPQDASVSGRYDGDMLFSPLDTSRGRQDILLLSLLNKQLTRRFRSPSLET